jgi:hypothetical protein
LKIFLVNRFNLICSSFNFIKIRQFNNWICPKILINKNIFIAWFFTSINFWVISVIADDWRKPFNR